MEENPNIPQDSSQTPDVYIGRPGLGNDRRVFHIAGSLKGVEAGSHDPDEAAPEARTAAESAGAAENSFIPNGNGTANPAPPESPPRPDH